MRRTLTKRLIWSLGSAVAILLGGYVLLSGGYANGFIRLYAQHTATELFGVPTEIGAIEGNPLAHYRLLNVAVGDCARLDTVAVQYRFASLLWGRAALDSLLVAGVQIRVWKDREHATEPAVWDDMRLSVALQIDHMAIRRGAVQLGESWIREIDFDGRVEAEGGRVQVAVRRYRSALFDPPLIVSNFSGVAVLQGGELALRDLHIQTPSSGARLSGTISQLRTPVVDLELVADSLASGDLRFTGVGPLPFESLRGAIHLWGDEQRAGANFDVVVGGLAIAGRAAGVPNEGRGTWSVGVSGSDISPETWTRGIGRDLTFGVDARCSGGFSRAGVDSLSWQGRFERVRYGRARWDSVFTQVGLTGRQLQGNLSGTGPSGNIQLEGTGRLRDGDVTGDARISFVGFDLRAVPGVPDGFGRISGSLAVGKDAGVSGVLDLSRANILGYDLGRIAISGAREGQRLTLDHIAAVLPDGWGNVEGIGSVDLEADSHAFDLCMKGGVNLPAVTGDDRWGQNLRLALSVAGEGAGLSNMDLAVGLDGTVSGFSGGLDTVRARFELSDSRLEGGQIDLWGENGRFSATGRGVWGGTIEGDFSAEARDLSPFGFPFEGPFALSGRLGGSTGHPSLSAQFSTDSIRVIGVPVTEMTGKIRWAHPDSVGLSIRAEKLSWGERELAGIYLDASRAGSGTDFLVGSRAGAGDRLLAWGRVREIPDGFRVSLDSLVVEADRIAFANDGPCALSFSHQTGLQIDRFQLWGPAGRIVAQNHPNAQTAVEFFIHDMDLRPWAFLLGYPHISGVLNGECVVSGAPSDPLIFAELGLRQGRFWGMGLKDASASFSYGQGDVLTEATLQPEVGLPVVLRGHFPFPPESVPNGSIHLSAQSEGMALSTVDTLLEGVGRIDGDADIDLSVRGTFDDPIVDGAIGLFDGRFSLPVLNRTFGNIQGVARVDSGVVTLDSLVIRDGGMARFGGRADLAGFGVSGWRINASARDFFAVDLPDVQARVDADLVFSSNPDLPQLEGQVDLRQAEIGLSNLVSTPGSIWESSPFLKTLGLRLQVSADRQVWVRDPDLNVEISGDVDVLKRADAFRVYGTLRSRRGFYIFQNRRLRIASGEILFQGRDGVNPDLDIQTETRQRLAGLPEPLQINVAVGGRLTHPEIAMTSDPPLDETDLLSVLATGRTMRSFGSDGDRRQVIFGAVRDQALNLMVGVAAERLLQGVGEEWNLDLIEVDLGGANVSRIRVGKYFGPRFFVSYGQDISGTGRELAMEFEVLRRLTLEGRYTEEIAEETKNPNARTSVGFFWTRDW